MKANPLTSETIRGALVLESDPAIDWDSMIFSFTKTDRMYIAHCKEGGEWQSGVMQDFQNLSMSPAAGVLNYGQGLFEGMKAQRAADGRHDVAQRRLAVGRRDEALHRVPAQDWVRALSCSANASSPTTASCPSAAAETRSEKSSEARTPV